MEANTVAKHLLNNYGVVASSAGALFQERAWVVGFRPRTGPELSSERNVDKISSST
jgi:hypothetical protein